MFTTPKISVGTMNFGGRTPEAQARNIIDRAIERGAVFFDTANIYQRDGAAERILGSALAGRRDRVQLATKVGLLQLGGKPEGLSAKRIPVALEESLRRLRTDFVDLYYLHAPDPETALNDTLDGLQPLLASNKIRAWGVSNHASWRILELNALCDSRKMPRPAVSQVLYNLLVRQLDIEYFAFTRAQPLHTTVYNPLAGGLLAHVRTAGGAAPPGSRLETNARYQRRYGADALRELAGRYQALAQSEGLDLVKFAYAWLAGTPGVDSILVGPGTVAHLDDALDAQTCQLSPELRQKIDSVYRDFTGTDACYAR